MLLALSPLLPVVLIMYLSASSLWLWCVLNVLVLYSCIGWQSLQAHVGAVAEAGSITAARERLAMIVSRETTELDHDEVAQAACESLLENSSDALFVSLFWFALGAAPLALSAGRGGAPVRVARRARVVGHAHLSAGLLT